MNPQTIRQALYYIRVPGPKSVAIETPEHRREIIHRCVDNERESLLLSISKLIQMPESREKNDDDSLRILEPLSHQNLRLLKITQIAGRCYLTHPKMGCSATASNLRRSSSARSSLISTLVGALALVSLLGQGFSATFEANTSASCVAA